MNARSFFGTLVILASVTPAIAQISSYTQTNLVSDVHALALNFNQSLVNPWGLASSPGQPFRIASNGRGVYQTFDSSGFQQDPRAVIALAPGATATSRPTAVAANPTSLFVPRTSLTTPFLFATEDGTISTEYSDQRGDIQLSTILVIDNSARGAAYTGLAVLTPDCCAPFLAAADFHGGFIDTFTGNFDPLGIPGAFTDPNLPAGYAPYNIAVIDNQVFVTYAKQDAAQQTAVPGNGNGIVDIYALDGTFVRRFASHGALNAPWGVAKASANFGRLSNAILIGNAGSGLIAAFDPNTGNLIDLLNDANGNAIVNLNLHGMVFGTSATGDPDTLYLTAGLAGAIDGLFASINVSSDAAPQDFSLAALPDSRTVAPGQAVTFVLTATPMGNFRSSFSFSCQAPTGISCSIGPVSVLQATGAASVTIMATRAVSTQSVSVAALTFPCFLLAGIGAIGRYRLRGKRKDASRRRGPGPWRILSIAALCAAWFTATGCGSSSRAMQQPPPQTESIVVTATAGSITHTSTLSLILQ
jgi:uncharacterized protein (TIGR03118 family)